MIILELTWVAKIEGIAAIIAILGGVAGFVTLFIKDRTKQRQIDELTKLAGEAEKQTFEMQRSNRIMQAQLDNQEKIMLDDLEYKKRDEMRELSKRREMIKPVLKKHGTSTGAGNHAHIGLKNFGGNAAEISYENNLPTLSISIPLKKIDHSDEFKLSISDDTGDVRPKYDFNIIMTDIDGNQYKQRIHGQDLKCQIEDPELVK